MTDHPPPSSFLKPPAGDEMDLFHPAYLDQIANAIRGPAVQAAIDKRIEQIVRFGHDAEHDAMQPVSHLPREARLSVIEAIEVIEGSRDRQDLPAARKKMIRAAALCLAAVDRLDGAIAAQAKQGGLGL